MGRMQNSTGPGQKERSQVNSSPFPPHLACDLGAPEPPQRFGPQVGGGRLRQDQYLGAALEDFEASRDERAFIQTGTTAVRAHRAVI